MTDKKTTKRRSISKLRLYKAMRAELKTMNFDAQHTVDDFMEVLKDEVIDELTAE